MEQSRPEWVDKLANIKHTHYLKEDGLGYLSFIEARPFTQIIYPSTLLQYTVIYPFPYLPRGALQIE